MNKNFQLVAVQVSENRCIEPPCPRAFTVALSTLFFVFLFNVVFSGELEEVSEKARESFQESKRLFFLALNACFHLLLSK